MLDVFKSLNWAYPGLEVVHIVGIGLLLGNLVLLEVRVLGGGAELPIEALARLSLKLVVAGFTLAAASGLLMFATRPEELLASRVFTLKMLLLAAAGCNAAVFHGRGALRHPDRMAQLQMLLSTLIWLAVITCGRWIAYE